MDWTVRYFRYQAAKWDERAVSADNMSQPGHAAYAYRQNWMWEMFASQAEDAFDKVLKLIL